MGNSVATRARLCAVRRHSGNRLAPGDEPPSTRRQPTLDQHRAGAWGRFLILLIRDTVHGFELRSIYASGWAVVTASVVLTVAAWVASLLIAG